MSKQNQALQEQINDLMTKSEKNLQESKLSHENVTIVYVFYLLGSIFFVLSQTFLYLILFSIYVVL